MCGIAGIFDSTVGRSDSEIRAMNDAIRHRGPDDGGQYVERGIGLGHRRLAIIDLSPPATSRWPTRTARSCSSTTARSTTTGAARRARGARPPLPLARRDTEVDRPRLRGVGPDCVERFNGMFAFAIWDARHAAALPRPRPATASSRSTTHDARRPLHVRLRDQGDPRAAGLPRRDLRPRRSTSTSPSRTSSAT